MSIGRGGTNNSLPSSFREKQKASQGICGSLCLKCWIENVVQAPKLGGLLLLAAVCTPLPRTSLFGLNTLQVTSVPEDQVLVAVFPGLPTSAELFILPPKNLTERRKGHEGDLEQVSEDLAGTLACSPNSEGHRLVPSKKGDKLSPIDPPACGSLPKTQGFEEPTIHWSGPE